MPPPSDWQLDKPVQEFHALWAMGQAQDKTEFVKKYPGKEAALLRELVWCEYLCLWQYDNKKDPVEVHLNRNKDYWDDEDLILRLIDIELQFGKDNRNRNRLVERFPKLENGIDDLLEARELAEKTSVNLPLNSDVARTVSYHETPITAAKEDHKLPVDCELTVEDRYRILRHIDEGGQKHVYEAQQINPGRIVALKTPRDPMARESMRTEGQVIAQLEHQNIPPIMNLADDVKAELILAERFIPGTDWGTWLAQQRKRIREMSDKEQAAARRDALRENLRYLLDVCDALAYVHSDLKVIHRDLKPANVMLNRFNETIGRFTEVYVVDWGLAVHVAEPDDKVSAPNRSKVIGFSGTPQYAAPEMFEGVGLSLSTATDVFLLGALLYELLTDTPPYVEKYVAVLEYKGKMANIPAPEKRAEDRDIPQELSQIAMKSMSVDPVNRYGNAAEFAQAIEQYLKHVDAEEQYRSARQRLDTVVKELPQKPKHAAIAPFIEVADQFRQVGQSWKQSSSNSPQVAAGYSQALDAERTARLALIELAEQTGDFTLAEAQLDLLEQLPPPHDREVNARRVAVRKKAARRRRARTLLQSSLVAVVVLLLGIVASGAYSINAEKARANAELARSNEEKAKTEAIEKLQISGKLAKANKKLADQQKQLADEMGRVARAQPWITQGGILDKKTFQSGSALAYANALNERDDPNIRVKWSEAVQRSLVPTRWSSQRLVAGSLAYSNDGKYLLFGASDGNIRVLDLKTGDQINVFPGHSRPENSTYYGTVRKIVTIPSRSQLCFTIGLEGTLMCRNFVTGEKLLQTEPNKASYLGLDIREIGKKQCLLVTTDANGNLAIRKLSTSGKIPSLEQEKTVKVNANGEALTAVAIHPKRNLIAVGGADRQVILFDTEGKSVANLTNQLGNRKVAKINDIAFSPDGKHLAAAGQDGLISVWDVASKKLTMQFSGHEEGLLPPGEKSWVFRLAFASPNRLFSTGVDGHIREWDLATKKQVNRKQQLQHDATVYKMSFALPLAIRSDGQQLASSGVDGRIRLWNTADGKLVGETEGVRPGNMFSVTASAACPKRDLLITCGTDWSGFIRAWDTKDLKEIRTYTEGINPTFGETSPWPAAVAIHPDGSRFAVGLVRGDLLFYDTDSGKLAFPPIKDAHTIPPRAQLIASQMPIAAEIIKMAWSRDGKHVVTAGSFDKTLKVWDGRTGKLVKSFSSLDPERKPTPGENITGPMQMITSLMFDPDNQHVVAGTNEGMLLRWNNLTGKVTDRLSVGTSSIFSIAFSPDGKWALTGGNEQVTAWNWSERKQVRILFVPALNPAGLKAKSSIEQGFKEVQGGNVIGLAFSPDLGHIAVSQLDGSLSLINTTSGEPVHRTVGHEVLDTGTEIHCYFTNRRELLTVGNAGRIYQWDFRTGPRVTDVDAGSLEGQRIAVSPDGKQWATRAFFGVNVWNSDNGSFALLGENKQLINPFRYGDEWPQYEHVFEGKRKMAPDRPNAVTYTPDGKKLIIGNFYGTVVVVDRKSLDVLATFSPPREYIKPKPGFLVEVQGITALAVDPLGEVVATNTQGTSKKLFVPDAATTSTVDLWRVSDGKLLKTLEWPGRRVMKLQFRPNSGELAAMDESGVITVWDWRNGKKQPFRQDPDSRKSANDMSFSPDGKQLVRTGFGGDIHVLDADTGELLQQCRGHVRLPLVDKVHVSIISGICFDKNGVLATAGFDGTARLWKRDQSGTYQEKAVAGTLLLDTYRTFRRAIPENPFGEESITSQLRGVLNYVVLSPDGRYLVTGGLGTETFVFDRQDIVAFHNLTAADIVRRTQQTVGLTIQGDRFDSLERSRILFRNKK